MTRQRLTVTTPDGKRTIMEGQVTIMTRATSEKAMSRLGALEVIIEDAGARTAYAWAHGHWATWTLADTATTEV